MFKIALILKEQKILIQSFLVRLVEKFFEFYLLVIGSFFLLIAAHFSPNNYFELKLIVLNHLYTGSKLF